MVGRIEHRTAFAWPAARVYEALTDIEYLTERLHSFGAGNKLVEHTATQDGLRLKVRQLVHASSVPPLAKTLVGSDLTINRGEVWRREAQGRYAGEVTAEVPGMPCTITGSQSIRDTPGSSPGSEFVVLGTVRVGIPLLGAKLEKLFVDEVGALLAKEDRFTTDWLARH